MNDDPQPQWWEIKIPLREPFYTRALDAEDAIRDYMDTFMNEPLDEWGAFDLEHGDYTIRPLGPLLIITG